jgi:hypothetical protein
MRNHMDSIKINLSEKGEEEVGWIYIFQNSDQWQDHMEDCTEQVH